MGAAATFLLPQQSIRTLNGRPGKPPISAGSRSITKVRPTLSRSSWMENRLIRRRQNASGASSALMVNAAPVEIAGGVGGTPTGLGRQVDLLGFRNLFRRDAAHHRSSRWSFSFSACITAAAPAPTTSRCWRA